MAAKIVDRWLEWTEESEIGEWGALRFLGSFVECIFAFFWVVASLLKSGGVACVFCILTLITAAVISIPSVVLWFRRRQAKQRKEILQAVRDEIRKEMRDSNA